MSGKTWRWLLGLLGVLLVYVLVVERPWQDDIRGPAPKKGNTLFPAVDSSTVTAVEIHSAGKSTRLEKQNGQWVVATEGQFPADEKAVHDLIARVDTLRTGPIASDNPARRATFGVDSSGVEVNLLAGSKSQAHFRVGNSTPDFNGLFVRPEDDNHVYAATGLTKYLFDRGAPGWRDRKVLKLDAESIRTITMTRTDSTATVTKQGSDSLLTATWNLEGNKPGEKPATARREMVISLARQLANLQADAFPDPGDAGPASWTPLAGSLTVTLMNGDHRTLEFGPKDSKGQHYVRVPGVQYGGRDAVYLMGPWRLKSLLHIYAELVEQPPGTPPAAAPPGVRPVIPAAMPKKH